MLRIILGGFLMLFSLGLLGALVAGPDFAPTKAVMTTINCKAGETYVQELGAYTPNTSNPSGGGGRSVAFYCQDSAGNQRDVTGTSIVIMIAAFVLPFLAGLALTMLGIFSLTRRGMNAIFNSVGVDASAASPFMVRQPETSVTYMQVDATDMNQTNLPPHVLQILQQMMQGVGTNVQMQGANPQAPTGDLTSALRQVQSARENGLITEEEYLRLRQEILDKMA